MAKLNWYNENAGRAFPFIIAPVLGAIRLPEPVVVDAGFTLGEAAQLNGDAPVTLDQVTLEGSDVVFRFTSGTVSFQFTRALTSPAGTTEFADAFPTADGVESADPRYGSAYLVTGDVQLLAPHLTDGVPVEVTDGQVEQALVTSESRRRVTSVSFANEGDVFFPECGSSDTVPEIETLPVPGLEGLAGDIEIMLGFNCTGVINATANSILLLAARGVNNGLAESGPCSDVVRTPGNSAPAVCRCDGLIFTINDLGPDTSGDIPARGDIGIRVFPEGHKLVVVIDDNAALKGCS